MCEGLQFLAEDHPRECGEKNHSSQFYHVYTGSPPRVRGKGKQLVADICSIRITPASAGKSETGAKLDEVI